MRDLGKELRNLQLALWESNDKPIYYISKIHGDKYIVPQKEYEKLNKENAEYKKVLSIINEYQVDIWLLKQCDYENYIRIRKEAMVSVGKIVNEDGITLEDELPEKYFDLLKEYANERM